MSPISIFFHTLGVMHDLSITTPFTQGLRPLWTLCINLSDASAFLVPPLCLLWPTSSVHWEITVATAVPPLGDHGNPWATLTMILAGNSPVTNEFPAQMASNAENVSIWWCHHVAFLIQHPCGISDKKFNFAKKDKQFDIVFFLWKLKIRYYCTITKQIKLQ